MGHMGDKMHDKTIFLKISKLLQNFLYIIFTSYVTELTDVSTQNLTFENYGQVWPNLLYMNCSSVFLPTAYNVTQSILSFLN